MTIDDYDAVCACCMSCTGMGLNTIDDSRDGIAKYLARNPTTCFVDERDGRITGVIIGGTSMSGGSGTMVGTLIGVFIMSVLKNGLSSCGLQAPWQTFLTGAVVIGAVLLDIARTKAANRVKKG